MPVVVDSVEGRVEDPRPPDESREEPNQAEAPPMDCRALERFLSKLERQRCRLMAD